MPSQVLHSFQRNTLLEQIRNRRSSKALSHQHRGQPRRLESTGGTAKGLVCHWHLPVLLVCFRNFCVVWLNPPINSDRKENGGRRIKDRWATGYTPALLVNGV